MKARFAAAAFVAAIFGAGCAAVLGLDAGEPLDGVLDGGADVTTIVPEGGIDAPPPVDGGGRADGACGPDQKTCSGCQSNSDPSFGCNTPGCASCATLLGNPAQVTSYGCGPGCQIGQCAIDHANCDNDAANGCESNLKSDKSHCGGCTNPCPVNDFCVNGACSPNCAPPPLAVCDASCVNTSDDPYNCTQCGHACPGPPNGNGVPTCNSSVCDYTCNAPFTRCIDGCFQTANDQTHCGSNCQNCASGTGPHAHVVGCNIGVCQYACDTGYVQSGNTCVPIDAGTDSGGGCIPNTPSCGVGGSACTNNGMCCGCRCNPNSQCCLQTGAPCNSPIDGPLCCSGTCMFIPTVDAGGGGDAGPNGHCL